MNLTKIPRRIYTRGRTPIEPLTRLSDRLGGAKLYIKRDDMLGLAGGGNKTRKLEFLVADALARGADTLVTCGAVQSNHCRLTLSAASREGLKCHLVLEERVEGTYDAESNGNNLLFYVLGVESVRVVPGGSDMAAAMEEVCESVRADGGSPYLIPGGGSNPIGATGYAACAQEILGQLFESPLAIDRVVTPSGSAGTHAGLVVGFESLNSGMPVVGINVSRPKKQQQDLVRGLVDRTVAHHGLPSIRPEAVTCFDDYVGPGYSLPTPAMTEAVELFARDEGILLDPVYTGKAAAGLIDLVRKGYFSREESILFLHTGGSPALYAYPRDVVSGRA